MIANAISKALNIKQAAPELFDDVHLKIYWKLRGF